MDAMRDTYVYGDGSAKISAWKMSSYNIWRLNGKKYRLTLPELREQCKEADTLADLLENIQEYMA